MAEETSIHQLQLENGLTLLCEEMPWLSSASLELLLPVGAAGDPEGQEGSAKVLNDWLHRGAGEYDSRQLSEALDGLGVRRGGGAGGETMTLSASLLADALPEVLTLYGDIVRRPRLEANEFEPARTLALQELASLDDNPSQRMFIALSANTFASPHGRSSFGSEAGLKALSAESVRQDYAGRVSPKGAILSVAGGVRWPEVVARVREAFESWSGPGSSLPKVRLEPQTTRHLSSDTAQTQIGVAYEAIPPGESGWYENALAVAVLSGGMGSRLFSEVREKRGLVYNVVAVGRAVRGFGYTLGYAGTTPERAEETLSVLLSELKGISRGVAADELERARTGLLSHLVMQGESSRARASVMARDTFLLGAPRTIQTVKEAVQQVTLDRLNTFLAARPEPRFTVLTLGPKAVEASA
jgi:predicted Zn-dependent peptidase